VPETVIDLAKNLSTKELELLRKIGDLAGSGGAGAWLVGGIVRDLILGVGSADLDIVIEGDGLAFARKASKELVANLIEYEKFLTATLQFPDLTRVDIATARTETYERPGSLPVVARAKVRDDMRRRDFTINAMAVSLSKDRFGGLFDPFGGASDIAGKVVRILHDRSFLDDPTRILRGVRFEVRFGFMLEPGTMNLLKGALAGGAFESISGDRLREEIFLGFYEPDPEGFFSRLHGLGILGEILPGADPCGPFPGYLRDARQVSALVEKGKHWDSAVLGLLLLMRGASGEQVLRVADRLNLTASGRRALSYAPDITRLAREAEDSVMSGLHGMLAEVPYEVRLAVLVMMEGEVPRRMLVEYMRHGRDIRSEVNGDDLVKMGYKRGPGLRRILEALLREKMDGNVNGREEEEKFVRENFSAPDGEALA